MTLYSALSEVNTRDMNIITAEDPIEYTLPGLNQTQMNRQIGLTFARALRSFLRMDPDVILVGEIRDQETAQIAVEAALTGHLLVSTLHTNDAPTTVTRLAEMGIDSVMEIVVEQHGFDAEERGNPPMMVQASVQVYITRVSDGTVLFNTPIEYRGHKHRFMAWADDGARKFRGELRRAGRVVARSIVEQMFVPKQAGAN